MDDGVNIEAASFKSNPLLNTLFPPVIIITLTEESQSISLRTVASSVHMTGVILLRDEGRFRETSITLGDGLEMTRVVREMFLYVDDIVLGGME